MILSQNHIKCVNHGHGDSKMNTKIIIQLLILLVFIPTAFSFNMVSYSIDLKYESGKITSEGIRIVRDEPFKQKDYGLYKAEIISFNDVALNYTYFDLDLIRAYDFLDEKTGKIIGGQIVYLNESDINLVLPYYDNAQKILIYLINVSNDEKYEIMEIDVSKFAKNRTAIENVEGKIVEPPRTEPTSEIKPPKVLGEEETVNYVLILILLLIVLIIFVYIIVKRRK
jgi:hypothetical protein